MQTARTPSDDPTTKALRQAAHQAIDIYTQRELRLVTKTLKELTKIHFATLAAIPTKALPATPRRHPR